MYQLNINKVCCLLLGITIFLFQINLLAFKKNFIAGRVLGYNNKPLSLAQLQIYGAFGYSFNDKSLFREIVYAETQTDKMGYFYLETNLEGVFNLVFGGVDHKCFQIPVILRNKNIKLEVRLAPLKFKKEYECVKVFYDFNKVANGKEIVMNKGLNGKYYTEIISSGENIHYLLNGICDGITVGTTAASYDSIFFEKSSNTYYNVVNCKNGKIQIEFDPNKLNINNYEETIIFVSDQEILSLWKIKKQYDSFLSKYDDARRKYIMQRGSLSNFRYNPSNILQTLIKQSNIYSKESLKHEIWIESAELMLLSDEKRYSKEISALLKKIPPQSYVWAFHDDFVMKVAKFSSHRISFIKKLIQLSSSESFSSHLLYNLCSEAELQGNWVLYRSLYKELLTKFPKSAGSIAAKKFLSPRDNLKVGVKFPKFSFNSADDKNVIYTNDTFKDKFYLIDFWATWCAPCVEEINFLKRAYDMYKEKDFEILSVSLDNSIDLLNQFRTKNNSMNWKNTYVQISDQPDMIALFEITFPKPFLIDKNGIIIEISENLRGNKLEKTLAKYIH